MKKTNQHSFILITIITMITIITSCSPTLETGLFNQPEGSSNPPQGTVVASTTLQLNVAVQNQTSRLAPSSTTTNVVTITIPAFDSLTLNSTLSAPTITLETVKTNAWLTLNGNLLLTAFYNDVADAQSVKLTAKVSSANGLVGQSNSNYAIPILIKKADSTVVTMSNTASSLAEWTSFSEAVSTTDVTYQIQLNVYQAIAQQYQTTLTLELLKVTQ